MWCLRLPRTRSRSLLRLDPVREVAVPLYAGMTVDHLQHVLAKIIERAEMER